jgi:ribose transport system ATP-binding protein
MVSSEMEEIIGMSDRVLVMHQGSVSAVLEKELISEERILKLSIGKNDARGDSAPKGPINQ